MLLLERNNQAFYNWLQKLTLVKILLVCVTIHFAVCLISHKSHSVAGKKIFSLRDWFMIVQPALERVRKKEEQAEIM